MSSIVSSWNRVKSVRLTIAFISMSGEGVYQIDLLKMFNLSTLQND